MDAGKLGFEPDSVIQELGWDEDTDAEFRSAIESHTGSELVDGDIGEVVDGVILWWREEDGDVGDGLVDALRDLSSTGHIWLMTPKVGRPGYVAPADIAEGTATAGLVLASPVSVSSEWQAQRIVRPRTGKR